MIDYTTIVVIIFLSAILDPINSVKVKNYFKIF